MVEVVVIGAGPGGLAVAAELGRRGMSAVVVDKASAVGSAWRAHYERLHLHTVRWTSHLPGMRIPRSYGPWVARRDVVRYLEDYAAHHRLNLRLGVEISRLERTGGGWRLTASDAEFWDARAVVVATGYNHTPDIPDWPGLAGYTGSFCHASQYRNAEPYLGRDVLVVGSGNTGAEIAVDLAEAGAARVRLAVRTVPTIVPRQVGPLPNSAVSIVLRRLPVRLVDHIIAATSRMNTPDLAAYGLPRPSPGVYSRLLADGAVPIIDVGLIDMVQREQVEIVPGVTGFDGDKVLLADSQPIAPEAVIAATGYRQGLERLVGHLSILDHRGKPLVSGNRTDPSAPGLYFTGYTNPLSGMFRELKIDARRIARAIATRR